jgi:hypothetical protein
MLPPDKGWTSVEIEESDGTIHSTMGIHRTGLGTKVNFECPPGMMITGYSASGTPGPLQPNWGRLMNLQFLCQDPVAELLKVR